MNRTQPRRARISGPPAWGAAWWLGWAALAGPAGCAFTDVEVAAPSRLGVATGARRGGGRPIALVLPFKNHRPDDRCGMKKNSYNSDTASVHCTEPPERVLGRLIARELTEAGFRVLVVKTPQEVEPSTMVITGRLEETFLEPKLDFFTATFETDIALTLTARTGTGLMARRRFYVKGEEATLFASVPDMERSYASGVRQLVTDVVGAVANLSDRFPTKTGRSDGSPTAASSLGGGGGP